MAVSFATLDQRLSRDVRQLHDYLWDPTWTGNEERLRKDLIRGAASLDAFLKAGGRLRKHAAALAKPWSREHQGSALYELLDDVLGLTAATELIRKAKFREAVVRAEAVIESTSIGVCSTANCFEIVEEWEARKIDFETYTRRLADALATKLVPQSDQFRRVLNAIHDLGSEWDVSASKTEQNLAARAATEGAAWCVIRSIAIRTMLGEPPKVPEKDFGDLLERIVQRL